MKNKEKESMKEKKNIKDISNDIKTLLEPELLSVSQNVDADELKEKFPHLHSEIAGDTMKLDIDVIEGQFSPSEGNDSPVDLTAPLRNYTPSIVDYLCRARTKQEAKDIINYSVKQGQLSKKEAELLVEQLEKEGVRSFGPIRTEGHYFRKAAEIRNREVIRKRYSTPDNK
ncbi:MAG: DUF2095 family protein [Candidatus Hodarchaeales archaeon]|jgi:hypothetical protein